MAKRNPTMLPNMVGEVSVDTIIGAHNHGMICEKHPWREWPHEDCAGPGMPLSTRLDALRYVCERLDMTEAERDTVQQQLNVLTGLDALSARLDAAGSAYNLNERAEKAEADLAALRSRGQALVQQWRDLEKNWRKGQMTREKRGDEVFTACADALTTLLQEKP